MAELLYRTVFEGIRDRIRSGELQVGDRLPSDLELSAQYAVSAITVKRALDLLRNDGYIVRRPRLGTFVVEADPPAPTVTTGLAPMTVGCVVTSFDDTFGTRVLEGILGASNDQLQIIVKRTGADEQREELAVRSLVEAGARGIVLLPSSSEYIPPAVLELVTQKFPVVILDRMFDGVPVSAVCSDNVGGAKVATEYLFELGHQKVGLITSSSHVSTTADRRNGYMRAHAEFHIPLDEANELGSLSSTIPGSSSSPTSDIELLVEFLAERPDVTAYLASEYNIAVMLREAARRLGKEVPRDLSIVCFDHPTAFADFGLFRFTHIAQAQALMGARAVEQVVAQIAAPVASQRIVVPTELVVGQSTRTL